MQNIRAYSEVDYDQPLCQIDENANDGLSINKSFTEVVQIVLRLNFDNGHTQWYTELNFD